MNFHKGDLVIPAFATGCAAIRDYTQSEMDEILQTYRGRFPHLPYVYLVIPANTVLLVLVGRVKYRHMEKMCKVMDISTGHMLHVKREYLVNA